MLVVVIVVVVVALPSKLRLLQGTSSRGGLIVLGRREEESFTVVVVVRKCNSMVEGRPERGHENLFCPHMVVNNAFFFRRELRHRHLRYIMCQALEKTYV